MAEHEPTSDVTATTAEPIRWPDPTRPIINERATPEEGWDPGEGNTPPDVEHRGGREDRG